MLLLPLLLGCPAKDADTAATCTVGLVSTWPEAGATGVDVRQPVEFHLDAPQPTLVVDAPVAGRTIVRDDGATLIFVPDTSYGADTDVVVALTGCGEPIQAAFHTGAGGGALTASLEGRAWATPLDGGRWIAPGLDAITPLIDAFAAAQLLVGASAVTADEFRLRTGSTLSATDPSQDPCSRTIDLDGVALDGDLLSWGPADLSFAFYDATVVAADVRVRGTFAADGSAITGGFLEATVDARSMAPLVGGDVEGVCDLLDGFGLACESCPDGEPTCLYLLVDDISAPEVPGPVEAVTATCE